MKGASLKTLHIRKHVKRRALERFGVTLNRSDIEALNEQIRTQPPSAEFLSRTSLARTLWRVSLRGESAVAVYDKRRGTVVTVWRSEVRPKPRGA